MEPTGVTLNQANISTEKLNKVRQIFPETRHWPDSVIAESIFRLRDTIRHMRGDCCDLSGPGGIPYLHKYSVPLENPGEFREEDCPAARKKVVEAKVRLAGFPKRFTFLPFAELDCKAKFNRYLEDYPAHKEKGEGLLVLGGTGTGKTQAAVSLGIEIITRYLETVEFVTMLDLLDMFKKGVTDSEESGRAERIMTARHLVILDDIGAAPLSDFDLRNLTAFFDYRYREMLPLVVTSNLNRNDLAQCVGKRTVSRLLEACQVVTLTGKDRREKKGEGQ